MKKLIEALQVIKDECKNNECNTCPMYIQGIHGLKRCIFNFGIPENIDLDGVQEAL